MSLEEKAKMMESKIKEWLDPFLYDCEPMTTEDAEELQGFFKETVEDAQKERTKLIEEFSKTQYNNECAIDGNLKKIKILEGRLKQARQLDFHLCKELCKANCKLCLIDELKKVLGEGKQEEVEKERKA